MRTYLKDLKPTNIEDLIAMNALYRPGPMNYIPIYINRKHGREKVEYPHELIEDILRPTFGIMVYQEQIMQTAQIMAGFSLGRADILRRAMGKKNMEIMAAQKVEFVKGAAEKDIPKEKAEEVFSIMERFAEYGFNRSHSAAYSVIAYHTAYLKAHYPAEYMAAVLTHNINDIKKITFFIDECKRHEIDVLGPDINESSMDFVVNKEGQIRFGLGAIKNVGESAVKAIIAESEENGVYTDIFDFTKRVNLKAVNKRCMESLAMAGAFDSFDNTHRAQYFYREHTDDSIFLEKVIKFAQSYQERLNSSQVSLFGEESIITVPDPEMPESEPWSKLQQLKNEKEVTGFYMSGHPLDDYKIEMDNFCNISLKDLNEDLKSFIQKNVTFAGIVTETLHRTTKNGKPFGTFILEDFTDSRQFMIFSEDYLKMKHFLIPGSYVFVKARVGYRFNSEDQLEVKVLGMNLLAETIERLANSITLKLSNTEVDEGIIEKVQKIMKSNPGKCQVKFRINDPEENTTLELTARNNKVNAAQFVRDINKELGIEFKLC